MKGFMRQRGDSWELRVFLGLDPATGKQHDSSRSVRGGKREAQRVLAEMVAEAERGLAVRTKATRGYVDRNLLPSLGSRPLARLKASDLDAFYRRLQASGGSGGSPLVVATVRRIHGILRCALGQGVKWGWIGVNPAAATTPPRVPVPDVKPPARDELARVLRRAADELPELACYLILAAATGARRSEVVAWRWSDLDLVGGTVSIARGVVLGPDGLVVKDTKTHSARRVSLDARTTQVVTDHHERMRQRAALCRLVLPGDAFVFSNSADGSEPWFPASVSRAFKRLCRMEGMGDVRLHFLRHFVATQLLSAGVDVRTVAGRLGHRNAATTLNVYAHFLVQADRDAADIIGNVIALDAGKIADPPSRGPEVVDG